MNKRLSIRQMMTHGIATVLGILLTVGGLQVLPTQANPITVSSPGKTTSTFQLAQTVLKSGEEVSTGQSSNTDGIGAGGGVGHNFVAAAVQQVGPAVVRIDTERVVTRQLDPFFDDPFFRQFFGNEMSPGLPRQERQQGQGSGFIVDPSGIILTNAHVVDQADRVTVTLKDGRTFNGDVRGTDEVTDLAVVKINVQDGSLPYAALGDSDSIQVGDWAIAVGNPLGLDNTVTLGIVSTLARSSAQVGIPDKRVDFIQTDAAINPGNSGGPLLNAQGEIIGINTAIRANAEGIGFAIPINQAKAIQDRLVRGEKVAHPYIGIQMTTLTPEMARDVNQDPNATFTLPEVRGVVITRVLPGTPAEAAGLRRGDVITRVDDQAIVSADQLQRMVERSRVGQSLQVELLRGDRTQRIAVQTAELEKAS